MDSAIDSTMYSTSFTYSEMFPIVRITNEVDAKKMALNQKSIEGFLNPPRAMIPHPWRLVFSQNTLNPMELPLLGQFMTI